MRLLALLTAALALVSAASAQDAPPVQYFGQDAPASPSFTLDPNGGAATARATYLAALDPSTVEVFDFEPETPDATDTTPERSATAGLTSVTTARFKGYGAEDEIPADVRARNGSIVELSANTNQIGTWPTSGDNYLYVVAYDGSNASVNGTAGVTQAALRLEYDASAASPGKTPKPFSAFGAYITDTEGYGTIRLRLRRADGTGNVNLNYNPVTNEGETGSTPGNGNVIFVGFTDADTQYDRITISFRDRKAPAGGGTPVDNEAFGFDDFTVGEINQVEGPDVATTVPAAEIADEPGWRLLSAPVRGVTVDDLAQQNLVQGVPAGDGASQQQYPEAASNFYWAYQGGTRWDYVPVPTTGTTLRPGRGFWWYWYDRDITPASGGAGGGTSASVELDGFQLTGAGPELVGPFSESFDDNTNCASDQASCAAPFTTPNGDPTLAGAAPGTVTPNDDDFYMIGNPFPYPADFGMLSVTGGTLAAQGFIWNPGNPSGLDPRTGDEPNLNGPGTYEIVFETPPPSDPDDPTPQGAIAVWNGMLIEVTKTAAEVGDPVVFTFDPAAAASAEDPPFHGKTASGAAPEAYVRFAMFGETESGGRTRDEAAFVRFLPGTTLGWDREDASKPAWPGGPVGLIAPMGERDGAPEAQAVMALPEGAGAGSVPLSIQTTEAGTYDLVWRTSRLAGVLRDLETGDVIDLGSAERYTFTAEATGEDWAPRFVLGAAVTVDGESAPEASGAYVGRPSPNPSTGGFSLDLRLNQPSVASVALYDALGREVYREAVSAHTAQGGASVTVPTGRLAAGAYVVVVEADGVREARRVTVVR